VDVDANDFFEHSSVPHTPGHPYKLFKNAVYYSITSNRAAFYSERVGNVWNKLPGYTDFSSLASFNRGVLVTDFIAF